MKMHASFNPQDQTVKNDNCEDEKQSKLAGPATGYQSSTGQNHFHHAPKPKDRIYEISTYSLTGGGQE
eukprot:scaffold80508_cov60-Attheya_sp.AAC.6